MEIFWLHFLNPLYLYAIFLTLILFLILSYFISRKTKLEISFYDDLKKVYGFSSIYYYLKLLVISTVLLLFFALFADPQEINVDEKINKNGIDIVIALDVSVSMQADDLKPNRIESAKSVIWEFLDWLQTDRVWLVVFAWKPFTSIPLTYDYDILKESISLVNTSSLNQSIRWLNWTAVWDALFLSKSLFRLDDEENKDREKVIILLTDWAANKWTEPVLVAKLLAKEGIKIYSIWLWSKQGGYMLQDGWPIKVDPLNEQYLKDISKETWWMYFRAVDEDALENIFKQLAELEKTDIEVSIKKSFSEAYDIFVYLLIFFSLVLILLEIRFIKK